MAQKFAQLRAAMTPEAQTASQAQAEVWLAEMFEYICWVYFVEGLDG